MEEDLEDENVDCNLQVQPSEDALDKKTKPPNKRRFEEEMLDLTNQIKEKETEMESLKSSGALHISKELNSLRAEKSAKIAQRREIDEELERINNKILPEKMKQLNQLELSLYYKNEEKINTAIQRLEWNLKAHSYKLSEEKKIVSEIDGLRRSKKTLGQYLTLKQEIGVIRDQLRHLREERDALFRSVSQIKAKEEKLKADASGAKSSVYHLKKALDALYETRRSIQASFRRQKDEYHEVKERQKQEGLRRKESFLLDKRKRIAEKEAAKVPFEEEVHLCNTLIAYLGRFNTLPVSESSVDSQDDPEFAEEIGDGQYILLKKSGVNEADEPTANSRKLIRRNRRSSRKQSMIKQMTHTAEVLNQFLTLRLVAPATTADVGDTLNQLVALKAQYEQEQDQALSCSLNEVASDAGVSATESLICEMSRQVSKTESSEEGLGTGGSVGCASSTSDDQVASADLLACYTGDGDGKDDRGLGSQAGDANLSQPEGEECGAIDGAIGGYAGYAQDVWANQDGAGQNSDSTVEGDSGSVESQASLYGAGVRGSSDVVEGAVGGEVGESVSQQSPPKPVRPVLLYSEMLNLPPRVETSSRLSGQRATTPSLSPGKPKHPPLSPSTSAPAGFYGATSAWQQPIGATPHSHSFDSAGSKPAGQKVQQERSVRGNHPSDRGNQLTVGSKNATAALHRRSTFSGRGRENPKGYEKSKTAVERRETFSGNRRDRPAIQQRQSRTSSDQNQKGNARSWRGSDLSLSKDNDPAPRRPSDFFYAGSPGSSLPPLSVSWSGIASGSIRRSIGGGATGASYSSVVSPLVSHSPSFPETQSLHVDVNPTLSGQSSVSPGNHQKRTLSSRASFPCQGQTHGQQKTPLGPRASLSQLTEPPTLPSPMGNSPDLGDHEQDFPPLSLSASFSSLVLRRNSSNSSFSARSADQQHSSLDKLDSTQSLSVSPITKPLQLQVNPSAANVGNGIAKNLQIPGTLDEAGSCDRGSASVTTIVTATASSAKEVSVPLSVEQNVESQSSAVSQPAPSQASALTAAGSGLVSARIPTDEAFTARWIADHSPPESSSTSASHPNTSAEFAESTHL